MDPMDYPIIVVHIARDEKFSGILAKYKFTQSTNYAFP